MSQYCFTTTSAYHVEVHRTSFSPRASQHLRQRFVSIKHPKSARQHPLCLDDPTAPPSATSPIPDTASSTQLIAVPLDITDPLPVTPSLTNGILPFLRRTLLPAGFPSTVADNYIPFSIFNFQRQLYRSAYYVLGTSSLLVALSLDRGAKLTLSAALTWAVKDGLGLLVKAVLSASFAARADSDPKRARMIGEVLMALSGVAEASSALRPSAFLLFAAAAGVLRQAGDALSGPSYRVFLDSLATSRNIGDVSARGEVHIVSGKLAGLALGAVVVGALSQTPAEPTVRLPATAAAFIVLAASHLAAARAQVRAVQLRTLNAQRLDMIMEAFVGTGEVLSVEEVARRERVFWSDRAKVVFGVPLERIGMVGAAIRSGSRRHLLKMDGECVAVALAEDAATEHVLCAALGAYKLLEMGVGGAEVGNAEVEMAEKWADARFEEFWKALAAQRWATSRLLFDIGKSRYCSVPRN